MDNETKLPIPPKLMLLDLVGMLMAGLGLAKQFAEVDVIPAPLRFDNYGIVFIVVGFALTIPALSHIIRTARARKPA